jgi:hypothetical protein
MSIGVTLIIAAVAIFLRRRIRDYALARADDPSRTRYAGPITVERGHQCAGNAASFVMPVPQPAGAGRHRPAVSVRPS